VTRRARAIGPDGNRIGLVSFNTHPLSVSEGVSIDVGANWENGATNRATRMRRLTIGLRDATVVAGSRTIMRDGRILWDQF
jgi:hypothetical protein